jgi:hypothetical protein
MVDGRYVEIDIFLGKTKLQEEWPLDEPPKA